MLNPTVHYAKENSWCPNCDKLWNPDYTYCPDCGTELSDACERDDGDDTD